MLIRSQDGKKIFFTNAISGLGIEKTVKDHKECNAIGVYIGERTEVIGHYLSEEKAIQILDSIENRCEDSRLLRTFHMPPDVEKSS